MAVKLPDTLVPMADFPSAFAKDVQFTDGENLQDKLDNGKLGSSSSDTGLTEEQANNIEKIPSIEGIVTSNSQAIANKADKDHEHTEYLTEIPDEYVTDTELSSKGYATETFVTNKIAEASLSGSDVDLSGYATKDDLNDYALSSDLDGFESDLTEIKETTNSIIPVYNHINLSDIDRGKYFIDYKPWIKDGEGYSCVKVPVFKGLTYSSDEVYTSFTMFEDLTGKRTKFLNTSKQFDKINGYIPSEDGYLCLSFQTSIADRFMLVNSKYAPTKYTQYKKPYSYILGDIDATNLSKKYDDKNDIYYDLTVITVAKDGTGDYDNLVDAYNSIENNSINNRHLIKVKEGVYDFGEKFNSVTATNYVGILLNKHYVYFEGENPTNTILYFDGCPTGTTQITNEQAFRVALFHWGVKNTFKGHIKNFTLRAKNCRYTLHPETAGQGNGGDWLIENVIFDFLGNPNVESWKGASVGIGISCGEKGHFKNCKWTNFDGTVEGIVGHNNGYDYTDKPFTIPNCQLTFENCDFGNTIIHIDNYKNVSGFYDIFKLISCTNIARGYFGHQNGQLDNIWRCINKGSKITVDEFDYLITAIPEEYITETELNAKGYLTEHQDISNLQSKTDNSLTTTDKTVIGAINEVKLSIPTRTSELENNSNFITNDDLPTVPTKVSDLKNDSNFVTNSKMLEAIANAQLGNGEDNDIDLSIYQTIEESTLTTTAKTIPTAINELKSGLDGIVDLIKEYNPDETYTSGQICLYNNYLWLCKTVTTGTFEESSWEKQTDNITELDLNTIKTFLGLTPEQLETMANIISSEIRTDKVFSSSETYTRIDNALKEAKQYCVSQLSQKSTSSFKIATSVAEVTDGNYLYLIMNNVSSKYDIYALVDGNVEKLTTVEVNLDNYFTKTEIEADYLKKIDADGKYTTITTLTTHTDDTDIHITSDERIKWNTELDKTNAKLGEKADKSYVDDNFATMDKVNASLDELENIAMLMDFDKAIPEKGKNKIYYVNKLIGTYKCAQWRVESMYYDVSGIKQYRGVQIATSINGVDNIMLMREYYLDENNVMRWGAWKGFATVDNAKDVGVTTITPVDSAITGTIEYTVKNGICYVSMKDLMSTISSTNLLISTTMPKPSINCTASSLSASSSGNLATIYIDKNTTTLRGDFYVKDAKSNCSFSYPVAE